MHISLLEYIHEKATSDVKLQCKFYYLMFIVSSIQGQNLKVVYLHRFAYTWRLNCAK